MRSRFILIFGKRKVGKTTIAKEFLDKYGGFYISISSKSSLPQLSDISDHLRTGSDANTYIPKFYSWNDFFEFLFFISKKSQTNIIIDEFHNFSLVAPDVYSELKKQWDTNAGSSSLNLIVITSHSEFVNQTFNNPKGPLYRIANLTIKIPPFKFKEIVEIFTANNSKLSLDEIVQVYLIFGGYPKYYYLIDLYSLWNLKLKEILRELIFKEFAPLGYEIKEMIVNEFSKENKYYLSILQALASGKNTVTDIANAIDLKVTSITKYLTELEKNKGLIKRKHPLNTADVYRSKFGRYYISGYFENFWFKFIQPEIINYDMGNFENLLDNVLQDLPDYRNERIEFLLRESFYDFSTNPYITKIFPYHIFSIGSLWDRKTKIELVVKDDEKRVALLGKISNATGQLTKEEAESALNELKFFQNAFQGYTTELFIFTNNDISNDGLKFCQDNELKIGFIDEILTEGRGFTRKLSEEKFNLEELI